MRMTTVQDLQPIKRPEIPTLWPKETAKVIRRLLRAAFPATAFSVTIGRGAGVSSVDVRWTDGPTGARVDAIVAGFEAGRFDGMTDSYEYDRDAYLLVDGKPYRPGTKYVMTQRECSPALIARAARAVMDYRWAFKDAETEAKAEALVSALEANPCRETYNAFYTEGRYIYPGDTQGLNWGRDLCQLVNIALSDRTTTLRGAN